MSVGPIEPVQPPPQGRMRMRTSTRIVTLLTQAGSVVFAVLVALAVDQWWEDRENAALGRRAMAAVAAELRGNLRELERGRDQNRDVLERLVTSIDTLQRNAKADIAVSVNYNLALLSSAAWQTAQVTRALHFVPLDQVVSVARVYDLQAFVVRSQEVLAEQIGGLGGSVESDVLPRLRDVRGRYATVEGLRRALATAYQCVIAELEDRTPAPSAECEGFAGS